MIRVPLFSLFFLLGFVLLVDAQETEFNPLGRDIPVEELDAVIRLQLEWIELESSRMIELLADDEAMRRKGVLSSNAGPLRDAIMELVEDKDATILETSILNARSGQRAKVESITEYIYPTEYDPPGTLLSGSGDKKSGFDAFTYLPQATAFETRNLGVTVEVDPVIGIDNRVIDLNLAPELVYLVDEQSYGHFEHEDSEVDVVMPVIYTIKTTTQIATIDGEYFFLGSHTPFNEKEGRPDRERKVALFLKADIIYVGLSLEEDDGEEEE